MLSWTAPVAARLRRDPGRGGPAANDDHDDEGEELTSLLSLLDEDASEGVLGRTAEEATRARHPREGSGGTVHVGDRAAVLEPIRRRRAAGQRGAAALVWLLDRRRGRRGRFHRDAASSQERIPAATTGVPQRRPKRGLSVILLPLLLPILLFLVLWPTSLRMPSPLERLLLGLPRLGEAMDAAGTPRLGGRAPRDGHFMVSALLAIVKWAQGRRIPPWYVDCTDAFLPRHTSDGDALFRGHTCASASALPTVNGFCVSWAVDMDPFWMDRWTDWKIGPHNHTHQCFDRIHDRDHRRVLRSLSTVQFPPGDRSVPRSVLVKRHTGSGWGVDWAHVVDGMLYAIDHETIPVLVVSPKGWTYASAFDAPGGAHDEAPTGAACASRDLHCFVLPTHNLSIRAAEARMRRPTQEPIRFLYEWRGFAASATTLQLLAFATRARMWLRREGALLASQTYPALSSNSSSASSFCVAFHVRRGDVVLHGKYSRRYHAIAEYVHAYQGEQQNRQGLWNPSPNLLDLDEILLMTDDANAVAEAQALYPHFRWVHVQRHRHHGSEGGWENPLPSGNATYEVVVLQALEQLLRFQGRSCDVPVLVHSKSNLADYMYAHLLMANANAIRIDLDRSRSGAVHAVENARSVELSRSAW